MPAAAAPAAAQLAAAAAEAEPGKTRAHTPQHVLQPRANDAIKAYEAQHDWAKAKQWARHMCQGCHVAREYVGAHHWAKKLADLSREQGHEQDLEMWEKWLVE
eukprot:gene3334-7867_t